MHRRTRFVCVSDTHNASPADGAFKLPAGDVLVHAGDLTKQGTAGELRRTLAWLEAAPFEAKLVVAGNHDISLDAAFYAAHGAYWHNQRPQDPEACRRLFAELAPSVTYLEHEAVEVRLRRPDGPGTRFSAFGSPLSPRQRTWAFQYPPEDADALWAQLPLHTDVLISHTPPKFHCDEFDGRIGCEALRRALWRVRPRLAICGHIHDARGAERVRWDLDAPNVRFKELNVGYWEDASHGTKKQSLLDLSQRGGEPLLNDGSHPASEDQDVDMLGSDNVQAHAADTQTVVRLPRQPQAAAVASELSATQGLGGLPPTGRSDTEALVGRLGRQETCVVNASIMASSWPYQGTGSNRYNKPIVVDIDLPVWR